MSNASNMVHGLGAGLSELLTSAPLAAAAANPGAMTKLWFRAPAQSATAHTADELFLFIFWFSVLAFVVLMFLMVYWSVKYRRRPGKIAPPSPSHNTPLEIAWTVLPLVLLAYIFFKGFHGYVDQLVAPANALEINIRGQKWNWTAEYPNGATTGEFKDTSTIGTQAMPIFYVPGDRPVKFKITSLDVLHSFWVPDFRMKQDAIPNRYTSWWFKSPAPDGVDDDATDGIDEGFITVQGRQIPYRDHWIFCAEYCGTYHAEMYGIIRVVPEEYFNEWMVASAGAGLSPIELGAKLHKSKCASCHSADGSKNTGPTWKNAYGYPVEFHGGGSLDLSDPNAWDNYIRESILRPQAKVHLGYGPTSQMQSFEGQLKPEQIDAIVAYYRSLSDRGGASEAEATPPPAN
ncbi:MAG: cytochrome c oxidase subunit II [Planctomycetota bacterium]|nr:cytochrome c oxidase subunit II [Planctomycetota bacterium]